MSRALQPPAVVRCTPRPVATRHLNSYADNAAPESIELQLQARRAELRCLEKHIAWLDELLTVRNSQIAAGVWPAAPAVVEADHA